VSLVNRLATAAWFTHLSICIGLLVPLTGMAQNEACGELRNHYGPYDYRVDRQQLPIVENNHFTPPIEALRSGTTSASVEDDIGYTLRAFPNHPRALAAIVRLADRKQSRHPSGLQYSIDCYFERAIRFRADDNVVRMLYAQWLGKTARKEEAMRQLAFVKPGDNPLTLNNLGLIYAEIGEYSKALDLAHQSQALGYTRPTLQRMLQKAGHWREPSPPQAAASAPGAGASSASN